jgi:ribosomal protein RSM22 (predicted rRNA methylase)
MNENLKLEASLRPEITGKIIDQISIINGYIQIVLLRYPGDTFLNECLSEISNSADKVTEQVLLDVGYGPATIKH